MLDKFIKKDRRKKRIRAKVAGTPERPRLAIFASNKHIVAQIIDDISGKTLAYVTDETKSGKIKGTKTESSIKVGHAIAEKAAKVNIRDVVFDRGGKLYHGRIKALAEAAREKGLKF
jgi:large subunit ribosomal protein L18